MADPYVPGSSAFQIPAPQPIQWRYQMQDNGRSLATFLGDVQIDGAIIDPANVVWGPRPSGGDDRAALQALQDTGKIVVLWAGLKYKIAGGVQAVTGSGFISSLYGVKVKIEAITGPTGFNVVDTGGTRYALDRCMYSCNGVDNITLQDIEFSADATKQVVIYPIRVSQGMATEGFVFDRLGFKGFSVGVAAGLNSVGAGRNRYVGIDYAVDSGATQGNTYWTGAPQLTVVEIDNDVVAGVYSQPISGLIRGIRNWLFSGQALTDYGQQTDGVNILGGATSPGGHTFHVVRCVGVGELFDCFGWNCRLSCDYVKNTYNDAAKLIHGGSYNQIVLGAVEATGRSVAAFFGSTLVGITDTQYNSVRVGTVKAPGTYGLGLTGETSIFLLGNTTTTFKPSFNYAEVDNVLGDGVNLDYMVRDGGSGNNLNNEFVFHRASGWAIVSVSAPVTNARVHNTQRSFTQVRMSAAQSIPLATATVVQFNTVETDVEGIADVANFAISPKWPGVYDIEVQIRCNAWGVGSKVVLEIFRDAALVATHVELIATNGGTEDETPGFTKRIYLAENQLSGTANRFTVKCTQSLSGGAQNISNATTFTYFGMARVN